MLPCSPVILFFLVRFVMFTVVVAPLMVVVVATEMLADVSPCKILEPFVAIVEVVVLVVRVVVVVVVS